jgi:hypothetical protein
VGAAVRRIGMARALFTTETGRTLLLRAARMKPGTAIMDSIWQDAGSKMPRLAAARPVGDCGGCGFPKTFGD